MNTHQLPLPGLAVARPQPLTQILALATRALRAFPECTLSWSLILEWGREQLGLQRGWSERVRAIDDELEREFPLFVELFENDPPRKRAHALAILRRLRADVELRAREITPQ